MDPPKSPKLHLCHFLVSSEGLGLHVRLKFGLIYLVGFGLIHYGMYHQTKTFFIIQVIIAS